MGDKNQICGGVFATKALRTRSYHEGKNLVLNLVTDKFEREHTLS